MLMFAKKIIMYKVKINYNYENVEFILQTELPKIPNKSDVIGFWHNNMWLLLEVDYLVYELDENNNYLITEINVKD